MSDTRGDTDPVEILCPECDYNLHALTSDRCPWCGWKIDANTLIEEARSNPTTRRLSAGLTALLVGGLTLTALGALTVRARQLTLFDAIAVAGVGIAAVGHFVLGFNVLFCGRRFPLRRSLSADLLLIVACLSLSAAAVGAIEVWNAAPTARVVRGVQVNGVLEFTLTASVYALPGLLLLALRAISYRYSTGRTSSTHKPHTHPDHPDYPDIHTLASFFVYTSQSFQRGEITQTWRASNRPTSPAVERLIREEWETQTALAAESNRSLFNGDLVRASLVTVKGSHLHFDLGPTCFRDFLGTNLFNAHRVAREDRRYLGNALGISSIVVTSDGYVGLGRRNDSVAFHAGFLHTIGGLVEAADRNERGDYELFGAAIRELREELTVTEAEIVSIVAIGVVGDRAILQPELLFDVSISATKAELVARFGPRAAGQEHTGLEFVRDDPDAILPFLCRASPVAPVAEAGLLIRGLHRWGKDWYEQACYVLYGELPTVTKQV